MAGKTLLNGTAYYNGVVYTMDEEKPCARAFLVRDGRFALVGNNEDVKDCPDKVDLQGRCVIPGLIDSHCHAFAGITLASANILEIDSETKPEELGAAILNALSESPSGNGQPGKPIAAMGFELTKGAFSARCVDSAISDRPVVIFSEDGHALLLNTKAMEKLGINRNTKDPSEGSYFCRDDAGNPTGLVIETPAMRLCKRLFPTEPITDTELADILKNALYSYAARGYTTLFEAMSADDEETQVFKVLKSMDDAEKLPMRLSMSFGYHGEAVMDAETAISCLETLRDQFSSARLFPATLKMFTDGTVEEHTALLYEPYADAPDIKGSEITPPQEMKKAAAIAAEKGFHIHIHAIGDKAVGRALEVLRGLGNISGTKTIAHNQIYQKSEIDGIIEAGDIFFQTTPHWFKADEHTKDYLGNDRYEKQFPVATMFRNGVNVSFGSDSCLEPITSNAFLGMYYAEARGNAALCGEYFPPRGEGIDRIRSLRAYTINGAKQLGLEQETGSIQNGKSADFVILDKDIMRCSLDELKDIHPEETYFRGRRTAYGNPNNH